MKRHQLNKVRMEGQVTDVQALKMRLTKEERIFSNAVA